MTDPPDPLAGIMVPAVTAIAATVAAPVTAAELRVRLGEELSRRTGWRRVVIPGDRVPTPHPGGPEAVDLDVAVRGRLAGRMYAAVQCAVWGDPDAAPVAALLGVMGAVHIRADAGYVVAAAPLDAFRGDWAAAFTDRPRATATLTRGPDRDHGLMGLRVPARVAAVAVANSPLTMDPGWSVRAYRVDVDTDGAELTL